MVRLVIVHVQFPTPLNAGHPQQIAAAPASSTYNATYCVRVNCAVWERVRGHAHEVVIGLLRRAEIGVVHDVWLLALVVLCGMRATVDSGRLSTDSPPMLG